MIEKLFELRSNTIYQFANSQLFPKKPTIEFMPKEQSCPACGKALKVKYTQRRQLVTMHIGHFDAHCTFLYCDCGDVVYPPQKINSLVPKHCNFGYDVIEYIGRELFSRHCTIDVIKQGLAEKNIFISKSEIAYLAAKYVVYLSLAHKEITGNIKTEMQENGGYILHIDGTCDGGSPHLMSALDQISGFVLHNIKIPTENAQDIIPLLQEVKQRYGNPIAIVTDMAKAFSCAITEVFEGIPHFICHFHFLRDIGKDLLSKPYDSIRKKLKTYKISRQLRYRLQKFNETDILVNASEMESSFIELITENPDENTIHKLCFILIHWCLDAKHSGNGYGFPFDRPHQVFYQRLMHTHKKLSQIKQMLENKDIQNKLVEKLLSDLNQLTADNQLKTSNKEIIEKAEIFDKLRRALHIAPTDKNNGLNDNGDDEDIKSIKNKVNMFCEEISTQKYSQNTDYQKLIKQIEKYKVKLFADPITVINSNSEEIAIQPQRTNNLLEQFFRGLKRDYTKRSGNSKLSKALQSMIADTPLIKNLDNQNYRTILLNGYNTLEERFAEIAEKEVIEKLKEIKSGEQKIPKQLKKAIRKTKVMEKFLNL